MIDEEYVHGLIDDFFAGEETDIENLNEIAASLGDPGCRRGIWERLLKGSENLKDPGKREALRITVYELFAEPPVFDLWLDALPGLLASPKFYWIVCGAYQNDRSLLMDHLEMLGDRFENAGSGPA